MKAQWGQWSLVVILALSLIGGIAVANESTNQTTPMNQAIQAAPQLQLERAKDLIGAKVINHDRTRLGTIQDIVLTPQRDAISYVALSYGGFMGAGGKLFAVPWSAFEVRPQEQGKVVILNVNESYLKTAKGFDKEHWPMVADQSWPQAMGARNMLGEEPRSNVGQNTTPTIGNAPASETMAANEMKYLRLSRLIGTTVKNSEGTDIGKLNNIVLDVNGGKVAYGILSVNKSFLGTSGKRAAIPWSAIRIEPEQGVAMLNVDRETLGAIAFDENHFPNLADPQYSRDLYQRFNARPYWEALGFVPGEQQEQHATPPQASNPGVSNSQYDKPLKSAHESGGCR